MVYDEDIGLEHGKAVAVLVCGRGDQNRSLVYFFFVNSFICSSIHSLISTSTLTLTELQLCQAWALRQIPI